MKKGIALALITVCSHFAFTQTSTKPSFIPPKLPEANSLLWRISGNGLTKNSFLFGTMHLKDKRLFNFDDSVYLSIENCEGMAMEINPDEMIAYLLNESLDKMDNDEKIKDVINPEDYKRYSKKLSAKFKKPADEISSSDIIREKNKWAEDIFTKGQMQTFVDAYLYGLARKQGKWVGGIEDVADQSGLKENFDNSDLEYLVAPAEGSGDESGKGIIENMIGLYVKQDLHGLYNYFDNMSSSDTKDKLLTRRNVKMARRMDSLSSIRTMFFAVGAAHLPGDSGVISLLRKKGFSVEPVFSKNKIAADKYKVKEIDVPWVEVTGERGLYSIMMPGNPSTIKVFGLIDMKFMMDISNMSGHYTMAVPLPRKINNPDSLMSKMAGNIFSKKNKLPFKKVYRNEVEGREYFQAKDNSFIRLQEFVDSNVIYVAAMFGPKKDILNGANGAKFFNSLKLHKPTVQPFKGMEYFRDSIMGIQFATPVKLDYAKNFSDHKGKEWNVISYAGSDPISGAYIMLFSKEVRPGYRITNDSVIHDDQYQRMEKVHSGFTQTPRFTPAGKIMDIWGRNRENPDMYTRGISVVKNNRNVSILVIGDSVMLKSDNINNIFSSFQYISTPVQWSWQKVADKGYEAWLPGKVRKMPEEGSNKNLLFAYDTTTATSFIVALDTFKRYAQYDTDSALWSSAVTESAGNSIIISNSDVFSGKMKGKEILIRDTTSYENYSRIRILIRDSLMYRIIVSAGRELLYNDNMNKFYSEFKIFPEGGTAFVLQSKIKLLLKDLRSTDKETRYEAYTHLRNNKLRESDLPLMLDALFITYLSPYDSTRAPYINQELSREIASYNSSSTVELIKNKFSSFTGASHHLQAIALGTLANIKTRSSYELLKSLLVKYSSSEKLSPDFGDHITDSFQLTKIILPELLNKVSDSLIGPSIAGSFVKLSDSSMIDEKQLKDVSKSFCGMIDVLIPVIVSNEGEYRYSELYGMVNLLAKLNTPESTQSLYSFLKLKNIYLKNKVALLLVNKNQVVEEKVLDAIAEDPATRTTFYSALKREGKEKLFPKEHLSKQSLGESDVYIVATDDGDDVEVTFLRTMDAKYQDKKYTFYLYRVQFRDDDSSTYLGVAGGYGRGKKNFETEVNVSGVHWVALDEGALGKQLTDYLDSEK